MGTIKKDTVVTAVTIAKTRKKLKQVVFDDDNDQIIIVYKVKNIDALGNEVIQQANEASITINSDRFPESLINQFILATKALVLSEF